VGVRRSVGGGQGTMLGCMKDCHIVHSRPGGLLGVISLVFVPVIM
jgi:hypothetical protein